MRRGAVERSLLWKRACHRRRRRLPADPRAARVRHGSRSAVSHLRQRGADVELRAGLADEGEETDRADVEHDVSVVEVCARNRVEGGREEQRYRTGGVV